MNAAQIASRLLEADPDDPQRFVANYDEFKDFDAGAKDIVDDARLLYQKLLRQKVLAVLRRDLVKGRLTPLDDSSVAQALIKIALERRGARGPQRVEKWLRRHAPEYL